MIADILILAVISLGIFLISLLVRNEWVFNARMKMIEDDYAKYETLEKYEVMMKKFWIWDVEKFVIEDEVMEPRPDGYDE